MLGGETRVGKCPGSKGEVEGRAGVRKYTGERSAGLRGAWVRDGRRRGHHERREAKAGKILRQ